MYGDFLVPTNTNVNNAITTGTGTKWELVETLEINGGEIIEYDKDVDNKTPLNINGYMLVTKLTHSQPYIMRISDKDNINLFGVNEPISNALRTSLYKCVNKNGFNNFAYTSTTATTGNASSAITTSIAMESKPFINDLLRFALVATTETDDVTGTVDVYFLRGV